MSNTVDTLASNLIANRDELAEATAKARAIRKAKKEIEEALAKEMSTQGLQEVTSGGHRIHFSKRIALDPK